MIPAHIAEFVHISVLANNIRMFIDLRMDLKVFFELDNMISCHKVAQCVQPWYSVIKHLPN